MSLKRLSRVFVIAAAAAVLACGESTTGPGNGSGPIAIGSVVEGSLAASDSSRTYTFTARAGAQYLIFVAALQGGLQLELQDASGRSPMSAQASPNGHPLLESLAFQFTPATTASQTLTVSASLAGTAARFEVLAFIVDSAPESRNAAFTFGDTVSGETLEPTEDVDIFTAHADSGQDFVAVVEAAGVTGLGPLELDILNPGMSMVGFGVFPSSVTAQGTTGRVHAGTSGTYQFKLRGATSFSGPPAFHGPYRFWTYLIDRAPEHRAAAVPLSLAITDERIDRAGDIDEFTFSAAAGTELNAFFQSAQPFGLVIGPPSGPALAAVSAGTDTSLFAQASGRFVLTQGGRYVASVSGMGTRLSDTGAYRFYLYPIDRRPEHVSATIVPGDTVAGEAIDLPGDIDEFTFTASAGAEFDAFLQAQGGSAQTLLQLEVIDADGTLLGSVGSTGADTSLLGQPTGDFVMRTTGVHRLRVMGQQTYGANTSTGPYRVFLYHVNPKPESSADTMALGDSLSSESIDVPGDIDEFRVQVARTTYVNLVASFQGTTASGSILVQLRDPVIQQVLGGASAFGSGQRVQLGALQLSPRTYIVHVEGLTRGPYKLWLYQFGLGPETARDTLAIGDTVQGESIDVPGDMDSFHFYGTRGQHVNIMLQGLSSPGNAGFQAFVQGPPGGNAFPLAIIGSPLSAAALTDHQTLRMDLATTGWYTVTIRGGSSPVPALTETGPYRFAVMPIGTSPETVSGTLAVGDSVTTEAIDVPGDWDEYTVAAAPGSELNVIFGTSAPCCIFPSLLVLDPATGDTLAGAIGQNRRLAGPFKVPAGGMVRVAVFEYPAVYFRQCFDATCGGIFRYTGLYSVTVLAMNRAPETVPAAYTIGDTVRTEAVFPAGDIDEFTVTATPGDTMSAWWRLRADPTPAGSLISLEVIDPANGSKLAGNRTYLVGSIPTFISPGAFVVPASGHFIVRFRGSGTNADDVGTAPYEFFVKRGP